MKPHLTRIKLSALFLLTFSHLSLAKDPSHIQILGDAIMDCLDSELSHTNPALARQKFLQDPLQKINILNDPLHSRLTMIGDNVGLGDVVEIANSRARNAWYHLDTDEVEVPGVMMYRNEGSVGSKTKGMLDRSDLNATLEELIHKWERNVGTDLALEETPKYRQYLQETGKPFDSEAYVDALLEQKGRRFANFENSRYSERVAYRDWLRKNGGINKIKKSTCACGGSRSARYGGLRGAAVGVGTAALGFLGVWGMDYIFQNSPGYQLARESQDSYYQDMNDIVNGENAEVEAMPWYWQFIIKGGAGNPDGPPL